MTEPILYTRSLSKSYTAVKAVEGIDFDLQRGKIHAIVGPNGAGKSTFVKLLYGELHPDWGWIFINSKEETIDSPAKALRCGIAMVSQDFGLVPTMTIADNLALIRTKGKRPFFFDTRRARRAAQKELAYLLPGISSDAIVGTLTAAQKQVVAIIKAMHTGADILIFDEPTSVLGTKAFGLIDGLLRDLKKSRKAVIYITHKIDEVYALADNISVFSNGKIVLSGDVASIPKQRILAYLDTAGGIVKPIPPDPSRQLLLVVSGLSTRALPAISFSIYRGSTLGLVAAEPIEAIAAAAAVYEKYRHEKGIRIGIIPDDRRTAGIFEQLSVNDNIGLLLLRSVSRFGWPNRRAVRTNSRQKVDMLNIACNSLFQRAGELSGGNQQKVLMARWMSWNFDLLILIEPTAGIDLGGKSRIYSILNGLKREGKSFLLVSSDAEEMHQLCDEIITLNAGRADAQPNL